LLADAGADAAVLGDETKFAARISSDVTVKPDDTMTLVIETGKFHFFDLETGQRIRA
jgi:hypothetical protein